MQEAASALLLHRSEHCTYWHVHSAQPIMLMSCVHLHSVYRPLQPGAICNGYCTQQFLPYLDRVQTASLPLDASCTACV